MPLTMSTLSRIEVKMAIRILEPVFARLEDEMLAMEMDDPNDTAFEDMENVLVLLDRLAEGKVDQSKHGSYVLRKVSRIDW